MNKLDVEIKPFLEEFSIVENPELIKVQTIKRKMIDQLGQISNSENYKDSVIIGMVDMYMIVMFKEGRGFFWVHGNDFAQYRRAVMMDQGISYKDALDICGKEVESIQQLFAV